MEPLIPTWYELPPQADDRLSLAAGPLKMGIPVIDDTIACVREQASAEGTPQAPGFVRQRRPGQY